MAKIAEGYMPFGQFQTYWRIVGEKTEKLPLLVVHGGPGAPHDYLTTLDDLAEEGRQVIYYDQCGCGRSPAPSGPGRWTMDFFSEELKALHSYLNPGRFHVLGHSWGGMLAIRFAHAKPEGLTGLVLASSPVSTMQWNHEMYRLLSEMPDAPRHALEQGEASGIRNTPEYRNALIQFARRHICCMETVPGLVLQSLTQMGEVNRAMKGESELTLGGALKGVDLTPLLPDIDVPTLVIAGKLGKCTPKIVQTLLAGIPGSRSVIMEKSAHLAHIEEREAFNKTVEAFLTEAETRVMTFQPAS